MDCNLPGSSLHGILQTRILEWVAIFFSRGSSWLRDKTWVSCSAGRLFTIWDTSYVYTSVITTQDHRIFHHLRKLPLQPSYNHFSDLSHHVLVLQTSHNLFGVLSTSLLSVFWLNSISSYISKKNEFFFLLRKNIYKNDNNSFLYNSEKLENNPNSPEQENKRIVVYSHNEKLLSSKKEWDTDVRYILATTWMNLRNIIWNERSLTQKCIHYDSNSVEFKTVAFN